MTRLRPPALPVDACAFLDAVAIGETGGDDDNWSYARLFGADNYLAPEDRGQGFPDWEGARVGDSMTHAAGRYQFEPDTYDEMCGRLAIVTPTFSPEEQDRCAWEDACAKYRAKTGHDLEEALYDGSNFADIAVTLHSEWTSLSASTFGERFIKARSRYGS